MGHHDLKTWPDYFAAVLRGAKTFEVRKDDRGFAVDDTVTLHEFAPARDGYTGSHTGPFRIAYILRGPGFGIEDGHVVMALSARLKSANDTPTPSTAPEKRKGDGP